MDTETSRVGKLLADQAEEIVKLKKQNAELVEALENAANGYRDRGHEGLEDMCRAAIAKATGGE